MRNNYVSCYLRSSSVILWKKFTFSQPEPAYIYTDINKTTLLGDFYLRLQNSFQFPPGKGYRTFDYPFYKPVELFFIESISIRLVI